MSEIDRHALYVSALVDLFNTQKEAQAQIIILTEQMDILQRRIKTLAELLLAMQAILNVSITMNGVDRR